MGPRAKIVLVCVRVGGWARLPIGLYQDAALISKTELND